ncbi:MAG: AAA family ATPase [Nitrospirae bacterium]|nr:AAA family ATPase [Nitrospirota bacterium]
MAYLNFYRLKEEPFSNAPLAHFFFTSEEHQRALARLGHAARSMKGLALVVGDIGSGKTTLARRMLEELPEDEFIASLLVIVHSNVSQEWLLRKVAIQLGVDRPQEEKVALMSQLFERLVRIQQEGKKAVVIIDEAQMLRDPEIFEEIRGMLNLETGAGKLITFIMFGLPEIEGCMAQDAALAQRVAIRVSLRPLDRATMEEYVGHRMQVGGSSQSPFTADAIDMIYHHSGGIPRLVNTLCDNALLEGFLRSREQIDMELVQEVARNLRLTDNTGDHTLRPPADAAAVAIPGPKAETTEEALPYRLDFSVMAEEQHGGERADLDDLIDRLERKR